jgi:hypothetical protein
VFAVRLLTVAILLLGSHGVVDILLASRSTLLTRRVLIDKLLLLLLRILLLAFNS